MVPILPAIITTGVVVVVVIGQLCDTSAAFATMPRRTIVKMSQTTPFVPLYSGANENHSRSTTTSTTTTEQEVVVSTRRRLFRNTFVAAAAAFVATTLLPKRGDASEEDLLRPVKELFSGTLEGALYPILRVREATTQETRLIRTGKFKDVQRGNVKLAVRSMISNYRLADRFVEASGYLGDTKKRVEAGEAGRRAIESLYTILEYFDSTYVENLRVGTVDSMAGKEPLVLNGLEAARMEIDKFLSYFSKDTVSIVMAKIKEENDLNEKEFDPALGKIINLNPSSS